MYGQNLFLEDRTPERIFAAPYFRNIQFKVAHLLSASPNIKFLKRCGLRRRGAATAGKGLDEADFFNFLAFGVIVAFISGLAEDT